MIRINRLIKKDSLYKILELPHVSKIELLQGKTNQKDPNVVRIYIYLIDSKDGTAAERFKKHMIFNRSRFISEDAYSTINNAINVGFIRESIINKYNISVGPVYKAILEKYNQEFFNNYELNDNNY
jgi:hypothetical protein